VYAIEMLRLASASLALAAFAFAQPADPPDSKCKLEGQIVSLSTGAPLRKAKVTLDRFGQAAEQIDAVSNSPTVGLYATASDANGRFLFDNLEPGVYRLSATRAGYLASGEGASSASLTGPPVKLTAGQHLKDVVVKLVPQAFIHGKVSDEDGDPVPTAEVHVYRSLVSKGKRQLKPVSQNPVQADASFVIGNLPPGRYYLRANDTHTELPVPTVRNVPLEVYIPTYFPSATDPASASPIAIAAGADMTGIEIRLQKSRAFHVKGRAVNTGTGAPARNATLSLMQKTGANEPIPQGGQTVSTGDDGRFEFDNVSPGAYLIQAGSAVFVTSMSGAEGPRAQARRTVIRTYVNFVTFQSGDSSDPQGALMGRSIVHVNDDVDNLTVPLGNGLDLSGSVRMEQPGEHPPNLTITLAPTDADRTEAPVEEDGTFHIHHIVPDVYTPGVANLPEGAYVKSMRFAGADILHANLDLSAGAGGQLEVVLSSNGAAISGVVRNSEGQPAPGATVQIWTGADEAAQSVVTDEDGAFHLAGLAPGDYRVIAWEATDDDLLADPAFRARFEGQATAVSLHEGSRQTVEVKSVARAAIEAEAAKVR